MDKMVLEKFDILYNLKLSCIEMSEMRTGNLLKRTWEDFISDFNRGESK